MRREPYPNIHLSLLQRAQRPSSVSTSRNNAAPPAAVDKEQQPCSSGSLGLRIGAAAAGRPLAEQPAAIGTSKQNAVSESKNYKLSCLPAEVLLNIVHCLDFNTLVALCFTNHLFHVVVLTNSGVLAKRREMRLYIQDDGVILYDCYTRHEMLCIPAIPASTLDAMRDVASHVGFHKLKTLNVTKDWRNMPMDKLFSAAPALRFVETLRLSIAAPNSASAKSADDPPRLGICYFDWRSFLRSEGALKLPELDSRAMCGYTLTREDGSTARPTELDWLRYCLDCTHLPEGVGKYVRFNLTFCRGFLLALIGRVANANRTMTVQLPMVEEFGLSTEMFSIQRIEDQYGRSATHYKSRNSGASVYRQHQFFTVTNDPTFDPFVEDDYWLG